MKYSLVVHEQRIIPDSEGAGCFRGSPGAYIEFGPIGKSAAGRALTHVLPCHGTPRRQTDGAMASDSAGRC
jgi:hypothetical protein